MSIVLTSCFRADDVSKQWNSYRAFLLAVV